MNADNMIDTNAHINNQSLDLTDPLDGLASGDYSHLQVFMSRKNDDHRLPQEFLYVDPVSFGKVWVNKVWLSDNNIIIEVQEFHSGAIKEISVDVDVKPEFLMVRWDDIVRMVKSEGVSSTDSELLEFDF